MNPPYHQNSQGFALLETLISMALLLVGLLAMAGLILKTNHAEMESYQRVQALLLLQDMTNRIQANRNVAACYAEVDIYGGGNLLPVESCNTGNTQQNTQATLDRLQWNNILNGATEHDLSRSADTATVSANSNTTGIPIGAMIGARGCVAQIAPNVYRISVVWQGLAKTTNPAEPCGQGLYGDDSLRRVVSSVIKIATLS